nr:photosystem I assembly protein Ycf4 [Chlorogonium euchlorum]
MEQPKAFGKEQRDFGKSVIKGIGTGVQPVTKDLVRRYMILGERRVSNYWWACILLLGSAGFLGFGISSYHEMNILPFLHSNISFFPQGLLMSFYGTLGFLLSFYWWFNIFWNVGGGFNEFNKKEGRIRIFRWGYPGKNRRIDLSYNLNDVEAIKVELKQGLDPQRTIFLKLKGKREIPLTGIGEPLTLKEIEKQASELANFLQVSLEGL